MIWRMLALFEVHEIVPTLKLLNPSGGKDTNKTLVF